MKLQLKILLIVACAFAGNVRGMDVSAGLADLAYSTVDSIVSEYVATQHYSELCAAVQAGLQSKQSTEFKTWLSRRAEESDDPVVLYLHLRSLTDALYAQRADVDGVASFFTTLLRLIVSAKSDQLALIKYYGSKKAADGFGQFAAHIIRLATSLYFSDCFSQIPPFSSLAGRIGKTYFNRKRLEGRSSPLWIKHFTIGWGKFAICTFITPKNELRLQDKDQKEDFLEEREVQATKLFAAFAKLGEEEGWGTWERFFAFVTERLVPYLNADLPITEERRQTVAATVPFGGSSSSSSGVTVPAVTLLGEPSSPRSRAGAVGGALGLATQFAAATLDDDEEEEGNAAHARSGGGGEEMAVDEEEEPAVGDGDGAAGGEPSTAVSATNGAAKKKKKAQTDD